MSGPALAGDLQMKGVIEEEDKWIAARRDLLKVDGGADRGTRVGLALSGGGIRSATFSLGVLQALSRNRCIPGIDYLSTVSGGSYIGSFFGALYVPPAERFSAGAAKVDDAAPDSEGEGREEAERQKAEREKADREREDAAIFLMDPLGSERGRTAVMRLREFGRYLTPGGLSDTLFGMSLMARNWFALQLVLGMVPLILFFALQLVPRRWFLSPDDVGALSFGSPALLFAALLVGIVAAGFAAGYWFSPRERVKYRRVKRLFGMPFIATLVVTVAAWTILALATAPADVVRATAVRGAGGAAKPVQPQPDPGLLHGMWIAFARAARAVGEAAMTPSGALLAVPTLAMACYAYMLWRHGRPEIAGDATGIGKDAAATQAEETVRARMTRALASANTLLLVILSWFVVDSLGRSVSRAVSTFFDYWGPTVRRAQNETFWASARVFLSHSWPLLVLIAPLVLTVWAHRRLRHGSGSGWLARPSGQTFLGFSILFLWLVVWTSISVEVADWTVVPQRGGGEVPIVPAHVDWLRAGPVLAGMASIAAVQCFLYGFLNLSSLVTLYAARLKRAYVGASNPSPQKGGYDVDRPGDLVPMQTYYGPVPPPEATSLVYARPVHLINVTVAQTEPEGDSHVVAYDRKGKPMHLSPAGVVFEEASAGAVCSRKFEKAEELSLSNWTAISGAAASTAIGSITSLGLSVLAMMANVRLGYWWKADTSKEKGTKLRSARDTVLGYLYSEFSSSFDTSARRQRRWYLTDGGHFENTGAYALLQRALDFIVICDNGADPDYRFDDLVRLIDRARTDLGAEITFLDRAGLDRVLGWWGSIRQAFGTYEELGTPPRPEDRTGPYATLARIRYARAEKVDGRAPEGLLMLIKPRLNFSEPPELLAYRRREAGVAFPQQTTLDQYFDEEQWEAYRRFGEVVGERLFAPAVDAGPWSPGELLRNPAGGFARG